MLCAVEKVWVIGGVAETPVAPDEPDELDGGDVVDRVGAGGLASSVVDCLVLSFLLLISRLPQNTLSAAVERGRFTDCRSMVTCCLSARFSRTN
jgi:hypothetical protein